MNDNSEMFLPAIKRLKDSAWLRQVAPRMVLLQKMDGPEVGDSGGEL